MLLNDLKNSQLLYALHFDETTTSQVKVQMDILLRYWSPTHNSVYQSFYCSLFFGHAEGMKVADALMEKLQNDDVPVEKMLTLIRDGPNVNKTIFRAIEAKIKAKESTFDGLVDLGSCSLHTVHNSIGNALEHQFEEISQLCVDLHSFFKYSAAHHKDYKSVQLELDLAIENFQLHTEVRWLSLKPAIERILEQYEAICKFITDLAKQGANPPKSIAYKRIHELLVNEEERKATKAKMLFLCNLLPVFDKYLLLFQKESPVCHIIYDQMCSMLQTLLKR